MIKPILEYVNEKDKEILSNISTPVDDVTTEETKQIIQDLKDTLAAKHEGKGLSAVQIGCKPQNYNITNKKVKCNCNVNSTKAVTNLNDISFNSILITNLLEFEL